MPGKFSDARKNKKSNKLEFTALPRDEPEPAFYHNSSLLSVSPPTPLIATTALSGISEGGRKGETVIAPPPSPERGEIMRLCATTEEEEEGGINLSSLAFPPTKIITRFHLRPTIAEGHAHVRRYVDRRYLVRRTVRERRDGVSCIYHEDICSVGRPSPTSSRRIVGRLSGTFNLQGGRQIVFC